MPSRVASHLVHTASVVCNLLLYFLGNVGRRTFLKLSLSLRSRCNGRVLDWPEMEHIALHGHLKTHAALLQGDVWFNKAQY